MAGPNYRSLRDPETLRRFVEELREGIYLTTEGGEILDLNPACLEIFGVATMEELQDLSAADVLVDPEQRRREREILARDGAVRDFELEIQRPDGEVRTVLDSFYAVTCPQTGERLLHGVLVDITDRKRLERRLRELAVRDPLTGCFNRRYLGELERQLEAEDTSWSALVFDIDRFKLFNDRFGHQAGDGALIGFARFLSSHAHENDVAIRLGGDEFLLLRPQHLPHEQITFAERLKTAAHLSPVEFSMGCAERAGDDRVRQTIQRADQALLAYRDEHRSSGRSGPQRRLTLVPGDDR